jgi:tetratricopeptide (TPR) repeat protein
MRVATHLLCATALTVSCLVACSKKEQKPAKPVTAKSASIRYESVAQVPEETRKELEAFARQLESDLKAGNTQAVQAAFSVPGIIDVICDGMKVPDKQLDQFKIGMQSGLLRTLKYVSGVWTTEQSKYKGVVLYKGSAALRFRFVSEEAGISLLDLVVTKDSKGKPHIVDFYNQGMGFGMVEQTRQTAAPLLAELDKTFLDRLLDKPNLSSADLQCFSAFMLKFRENDFAGVVARYKTLPTILRTNVTSTAIHISALQRLGDNKAYKDALKEAANRFKTANFEFMLVDLYFLDKEYDKAIECLDHFMQAVGKDAALLALKSLLLYAKHEAPAARTALLEAFQLEPDCLYAHAKGLDVLLETRDFARVRDSMIFLEQNADYKFKGSLTDPLWDEFKKAPESQQWR